VTGRQGRRRRKLLDDINDRRWYSHLKEETLVRTMWRARFGRGFGPVVRQTTNWMNDVYCSRLRRLVKCIRISTHFVKIPSLWADSLRSP
jgi:hypothetical protein